MPFLTVPSLADAQPGLVTSLVLRTHAIYGKFEASIGQDVMDLAMSSLGAA